MYRLVFSVLIAVCFGDLSAQKQTSFWIDRFYGYNFGTYPPEQIDLPSFTNFQRSRPSVSDAEGNLLFYTDGINYITREGEVMRNGNGLNVSWGTSPLPHMIAPMPGSETKYYIFTVRLPRTTTFADYDNSLSYSVVDMSLQDGEGDVTEMRIPILPEQRDEFSLIKDPDGDDFWIISTGNFGNDRMLTATHVTEAGISADTVNTYIGEFISQIYFKASPDGKFLCINTLPEPSDGTRRCKIMKFNSDTGKFDVYRELVTRADPFNDVPHIQVYNYMYEFSADSRFLYVIEDLIERTDVSTFFSTAKLVCYDMTAPTSELFVASRQVIYSFQRDDAWIVTSMQLTPQGRIVIGDFELGGYFHTIHNPEACSIEGKGFEYRSIKTDFEIPMPPNFPAWYFYKEQTILREDLAGFPVEVCPLQSVAIGLSPPNDQYTYEWAGVGLSNLNSPNPVFTATTNFTGVDDSVTLHLTATNVGGCIFFDSVTVTIKPVDRLKILGSNSVCPGVKGIDYELDVGPDESAPIEWTVEGGDIVNESHGSIIVDWGETSGNARVSVYSMNVNGCENYVEPLPVTISKSLSTPAPSGRDTLLCDDYIERYSIIGNATSMYEWSVLNGEILSGQGTTSVEVEWDKNVLFGKMWIDENVSTEIETCSGKSDTLTVFNPKKAGSENVLLQNISGTLSNENELFVEYQILNPSFYEVPITLQSRFADNSVWTQIATLDAKEKSTYIPDQPLTTIVSDYRILAFNLCKDSAISNVHSNMLLTINRERQDEYALTWNHYDTWERGVKEYTIVESLDSSGFQPLATTLSNEWRQPLASRAFNYVYYIIGQSEDGFVSLSNRVVMTEENTLFFPNVITPNGDSRNETWMPTPLNLYLENELAIYNRWGALVHRQRDYQGDWNGDGLPAGVYFFQFLTHRDQRLSKGYIHLIK